MPARLIILLMALAIFGCGRQSEESNSTSIATKQAQVVERGRAVMPFDLDRTTHHFTKLPSGGIQQVLSTDSDPRQIALIRGHLQTEAARFQHGDFSDPNRIHGPDMPGLNMLAAGPSRIDIRFSEIPRGAQITFATADPTLVAAIHDWFDAQVQEHGRHAMPM